MEENKVYKTPEGVEHKIIMFDELNKQVYINIIGNKHRWVIESEYSTWTPTNTAEMPKIYVPDIPAQMIEEPKTEVFDSEPLHTSETIVLADSDISIQGDVVEEKPIKKTRKKKEDAV